MKTARSFLTSLSTLVLLSLVLGLLAGAGAQKWGLPGGHATADFIQALGQLWLNALRMTIIPLVFSLLSPASPRSRTRRGPGGWR